MSLSVNLHGLYRSLPASPATWRLAVAAVLALAVLGPGGHGNAMSDGDDIRYPTSLTAPPGLLFEGRYAPEPVMRLVPEERIPGLSAPAPTSAAPFA